MNLWQFTWTGKDVRFRLVQVAAPTKEQACELIRERLGIEVVLGLRTAERVLCDKCGEDRDRALPVIISAKGPDGQTIPV